MKNIICLFPIFLLVWALPIQAQSTKTVTDLPNISVIGNMLGTVSTEKPSFDVKEIEFSFQHYLYPSVKADIFAALHKESDGERKFELEEGYVTLFNIIDIALPNYDSPLALGAIIGKKLLGIGKINPLHPEQRQFIHRPIAVQKFLGGEEAFSAEGGQLSYLLPLPFFSQVELGAWTVATHAHEESSEESEHNIEYSNRLLSSRLWNSLALSQTQELEFGVNYLLGNATTRSDNDKQNLLGLDLTLTQELSLEQSLTLQTEFYQANYGEEGESKTVQYGGYVSGFYKFNPYYQAGIRFGTLSKHGDEGNVQNQWTLILTRQLTDTSKFRIQYSTGENVEDAILAQFIFGMGPHSHVLQ